MDDALFRVLSDAEYDALSMIQKVAYLRRAIDARNKIDDHLTYQLARIAEQAPLEHSK
jgi:hypothetical protein